MTFSAWSLALRGGSARVPFLSLGRGRGLVNLALLSRYCTSRSRAIILASMSFESNTGFSVAGSLACSATVAFFQACGGARTCSELALETAGISVPDEIQPKQPRALPSDHKLHSTWMSAP